MGRTRSIQLGAILASAAILSSAPLAAAQLGSTGAPVVAVTAAQPPYVYPEVFPVELPGLGFAMPKQAFLDIIAAKKLTPVTNSAKSMFLVQPPGAPYSSVVYFFDSNAGPILNEMELRFADEGQAKAYFDARFPPNIRNGDQYLQGSATLSYGVKAWRFQTKVFIVATMPNTRWGPSTTN